VVAAHRAVNAATTPVVRLHWHAVVCQHVLRSWTALAQDLLPGIVYAPAESWSRIARWVPRYPHTTRIFTCTCTPLRTCTPRPPSPSPAPAPTRCACMRFAFASARTCAWGAQLQLCLTDSCLANSIHAMNKVDFLGEAAPGALPFTMPRERLQSLLIVVPVLVLVLLGMGLACPFFPRRFGPRWQKVPTSWAVGLQCTYVPLGALATGQGLSRGPTLGTFGSGALVTKITGHSRPHHLSTHPAAQSWHAHARLDPRHASRGAPPLTPWLSPTLIVSRGCCVHGVLVRSLWPFRLAICADHGPQRRVPRWRGRRRAVPPQHRRPAVRRQPGW
jgi:hypothetical protein